MLHYLILLFWVVGGVTGVMILFHVNRTYCSFHFNSDSESIPEQQDDTTLLPLQQDVLVPYVNVGMLRFESEKRGMKAMKGRRKVDRR